MQLNLFQSSIRGSAMLEKEPGQGEFPELHVTDLSIEGAKMDDHSTIFKVSTADIKGTLLSCRI